jgi:hypothetical protein
MPYGVSKKGVEEERMDSMSLKALREIRLPTTNIVTDHFGAFRAWGGTAWKPDRNPYYSPIHIGVDFRIYPNSAVDAPLDCYAYGENVGGAVGSSTMLRPVLEDGTASSDFAIYLIHTKPTASEWKLFARGEKMVEMSEEDHHGIGGAHLHLEAAATRRFAEELAREGLINLSPITEDVWANRAKDAGLDVDACLSRIKTQSRSWRLAQIYVDAILTAGYPTYKQSHSKELGSSRVGVQETWILNLPEIIKRLGR